LFKKSYLVLSGDVTLQGDDPPYRLAGSLVVNRSEIRDELADMASKKTTLDSVYRYIPVRENQNFFNLVNLDIRAITDQGIWLRNGLGEMNLMGEVSILGPITDFRMGGGLYVQKNTGRFYFKSNDFIIKKGALEFDPGQELSSMQINFWGATTISDHLISLSINGPPRSISMSLYSDPPRSQKEIFSLLTLGHLPSSVDSEMDEEAQRSLYSAGIGSFIFDRIKINQELKSTLGIQVSLQSAIEEDTSGPLQNRPTGQGVGASRVRSGTKVQVKKSLTKQLELSAASAIGGSLQQKQEMNISYELKKKVILQGVYESSEAEDQSNAKSTNSAGADLKFKWTFK